MIATDLTHFDLVERAVRWLRNTEQCGVVLPETSGGGLEIPDAIGWRGFHHSIVVECKTTINDYYADKAKPFRKWPRGMGRQRYYMTPPGLLRPSQVTPGWGLLEVRPKTIRRVVRADSRELAPMYGNYEMQLMYFALYRIQSGDTRRMDELTGATYA